MKGKSQQWLEKLTKILEEVPGAGLGEVRFGGRPPAVLSTATSLCLHWTCVMHWSANGPTDADARRTQCGLDFTGKGDGASKQEQMDALREQLQLAKRLSRPVSVGACKTLQDVQSITPDKMHDL